MFTFAAMLFCARAAHACSCGPTPTVLESYEGSDVVVITRVASVEKTENAAPKGRISDGTNYVDGVKSTRMFVEKVYKGNLKVGDELSFAQGGGADCIWTFSEESVGQEYLFYLDAPRNGGKIWVGFGCGRSSHLKHATDDLLYLNKLDKVRGKTRLSGTVEFEGDDSQSVGGRVIRITGAKKTYEVKTDANGVYEIYDLPAGNYTVEPEMPRGWKVNAFWLGYSASFKGGEEFDPRLRISKIPINIEDKKHAALDIHFEIDNVIRGRVLDAGGKPMQYVCVKAVRARSDEESGFHLDCTGEDGVFNIAELPPGNYILVVNDDSKVSSYEPFPTLYYPNVFKRENAGVITIGAGDRLEDFNIYVPQTEETITVEGVFLYSDGKPVADEGVQFKSALTKSGVEGNARTKTDASGRFKLKILRGLEGELFGGMYTFSGEFENCPKLEAVIKKLGGSVVEVQTPSLKLKAENNLYDVELIFSFPSCKKAKIE
jgi:hypothetical protein